MVTMDSKHQLLLSVQTLADLLRFSSIFSFGFKLHTGRHPRILEVDFSIRRLQQLENSLQFSDIRKPAEHPKIELTINITIVVMHMALTLMF